jgi:hypothetical protein
VDGALGQRHIRQDGHRGRRGSPPGETDAERAYTDVARLGLTDVDGESAPVEPGALADPLDRTTVDFLEHHEVRGGFEVCEELALAARSVTDAIREVPTDGPHAPSLSTRAERIEERTELAQYVTVGDPPWDGRSSKRVGRPNPFNWSLSSPAVLACREICRRGSPQHEPARASIAWDVTPHVSRHNVTRRHRRSRSESDF